MTPNQKLRADADRRRDEFFQTASAISEQLRPSAILDKVVGAIDPRFVRLKRIESAVNGKPLAVLVAVSGLWLVARQLKRGEPQTKPASRRGIWPFRMPRSNQKGDENGYINDAKKH